MPWKRSWAARSPTSRRSNGTADSVVRRAGSASRRDEPDALVVEGAAAADVGGARLREQVRAAPVAEVPALGHQRHVLALPGVVLDAHLQRALRGLQQRQCSIRN